MENKISVIIPVFKVENYLRRCIESIINQTYQNLEIILVNDGSPDNSGDICDEYAQKDKRIVVIHKKNEGSSCARNAGLDIATGDFISFVDSDDYIYETMLAQMFSKLTEYNLDVVEIVPDSKNRTTKPNDRFIVQDKFKAFERVISSTTFSVWCRLYKASVFKDLRFIPKIIHQDVFYTIDVLNRIEKIGYLNSALYYYNTNNESIIRSKYTSHKIEIAIKATEYIIENTPKTKKLNTTVKNYLTYYYTDHFFLLSRNTKIDTDMFFRKKLRKVIKASANIKNISLRTLMVLLIPIKVMEFISSTYNSYTTK